jgi:4-amino-4-deoxy-L-arabinose transferase-like glycosyltransferase
MSDLKQLEKTPNSDQSGPVVSQARIAAPMLLILCSLAALILSQVIRASIARELRLTPLLILPVALILFFIGIRSMDKGGLPRWMEKGLNACSSWLGIRPEQFISLAYSLVFCILACTAAGFFYQMRSPVAAILCWLLGIVLVLFGGWRKPVEPRKFRKDVLISTGVIFSAAFTIRAISTATIPIVLSGDEASSGLFSLKFLTGEVNNLFITGWFSFPVLHNFLQSLSIRIFGQTTEALRLLAAFGGALTVALVYLVGREMFGNLAGWAAAIFLTGLHFHNHFSRIGLNNIWDGFFFILVLGCVWIGWKRNLRWAWLLAGVGLGLAQYFYATGRMLFGIIPLWGILAGLFDRSRLKQSIPNLVVMLWVAVIVMLPLGWFYATHFEEFLAPMNRVSIFGDWLKGAAADNGGSTFLVLLNQIKLGFFGFFETPTRAWYDPGFPILRAIPGVIFLIGLAFTLIHPKDERSQLLWIWLAAGVAAVGFSESTPAAQRYVSTIPALALLVGFALWQLTQMLTKWLPKRAWIFSGMLIAASILLAADDLRFYYLDYTPTSDFSGFNGQVAQRLADKLKAEPQGTALYFVGYPGMGYDSIASLPYLAPQISYLNVNAPWRDSVPPAPTSEKAYFVFLPNHETDRYEVALAYPGGVWSEEKYRGNETLYWLYEWKEN